jgi:serine protease Do
MGFKHSKKRYTYQIVWTFFCLIGGYIAATLLIPVSAPDAKTTPLVTSSPGSFSQLVKKAEPSVVYISTVKVIKGNRQFQHPFGGPSNPNDPFREFFDRFFGNQGPRDFKQKGLGSGFIIDAEGYILTNNHVVEKSDEISVTLTNGKEFSAEIIGRDPKTDLALIQIKADEKLETLLFGDSDSLEVGDWVVAIGSPYGLGNSVTAGIVSSKYRNIGAGPYDNFIQTDAAINPGNSGGPLLNTSGEVIGINTAIFSQAGGSVGIGFAIPINMAKDLLPQLKTGKVIRGWLGVMIQKVSPELKETFNLKDEKGALVSHVAPGSPAEKAGVKRGDVIVSFDGKEINEMKDLPYIVGSTPVDKKVRMVVIRNGEEKHFKIKIGELKEEVEDRKIEEPKSDLGMTVEELTPQLAHNLGLSETSGVIVVKVQRDSPAAEAGLQQGDLILEVGQDELKNLSEFHEKIQSYEKGDTVLFLIKRGESTLFLTLRVEE